MIKSTNNPGDLSEAGPTIPFQARSDAVGSPRRDWRLLWNGAVSVSPARRLRETGRSVQIRKVAAA